MRVLLPPSEAKSLGGRGRSLRRRGEDGRMGADERMGAARCAVLDGLDALVGADSAAAAAALLLPPGVAAQALAVNARVRDSATTPALRRYCGVVYDGLSYSSLSAPAQRLTARSTLIFSGLLGVVRGDEQVPLYRVPAKATLPGIGVAGTFWRPVLDEVMPTLLGRHLVLDLRSTDYAAMWRPRRDLAARVVTVRVLSPLPGGGVGVVSYPSKFAKGRLAAALFEREARGERVRSIDEVAETWRELGAGEVHVLDPTRLEIHTR